MKYSELEDALQATCRTAGDRTLVTSKVPAHGHDLISVTRMEGGYRLSDVKGAAVQHAFGNSSCLMCAADFFSKIQRASFGSRGFKGATPTGSKTTAGNLCIGDAKSSPKSSPKSGPKGGMPRAKLVQKVKFPKMCTKEEKKELKKKLKAAAEETMKLNAKQTALDLRTFRQNKTALLQKRPELIAIEQVRAVFGNLVRSVVVEPHFLSQHEMDARLAAAHKKGSKPYFIEELPGRMRVYAINVRELTAMPIVGGIQAEDRNHALVLMALMGMAKILQRSFNMTETILLQLTQFDNLHTEFHRPDPVMNNAMKLHFAVMYKGGLPKPTKVAMATEAAKEAKDVLEVAVAAVAPAQELARQAAKAVTEAEEASSDDEPLEALAHPARLLGW